ncbi:MAG TPA: hypothetical protein VMT18_03115 [Planctomycetota bacterium]|nr:hypothetical protein [Planctomycetota bacterium]
MDRTAEDAALLERALREGWPRDHAELRALFTRRPEWAALLDGHDQVPDALGAEAEADRRLVDELLALAQSQAAHTPARAPRRIAHGGWLLAAALLLAIGGWWWAGERAVSPGLDDGQGLGGSGGSQEPAPSAGSAREPELSCLRPEGAASVFSVFAWEAQRDLEPDESYVIVVYSLDEDGSILGELQRYVTTETSWTPDAEAAALWPRRILWRVRRVSSDGARTGSAEAWAER